MDKDNSCNGTHSTYIRNTDAASACVIMVHGICGTPRQFDFLISAIPEEYDIYNILLSGHGGTVSDFSNSSMKAWISDVQRILDMAYSRYNKIYLIGHSMGTLIIMQLAERYADKISAMLLLASPLKMFMKPKMIPISLKMAFNKYDTDNPYHTAMRAAYSIEADGKLWRYLGWIPRYLELFSLARRMRKTARSLKIKTYVFQSENDELVAKSSAKYFNDNENVKLVFLRESRHFDYSAHDSEYLRKRFVQILTEAEDVKGIS